ncbi:MAG TPA: alpha/beta hydrolase [Anaerolineae bacterium]|nr:alpha/beta hydrolase [Anaerolineae bacterium]
MARMQIRGISLNVKVMGQGAPLVLMHGGPGADLYTMMEFRRLADEFTLVFYDHRCNGRSGGEVTSMTWENLTADADALRQALGFDEWAVLGHSFGGHVAIEYALRYPGSLSHLVLVNTGGESRWAQDNAPEVLAQRGFSPEMVSLARRWFNGQVAPNQYFRSLMKLGPAYVYHTSWLRTIQILPWALRSKLSPEAGIWWFGQYHRGWTARDRLGQIQAPTVILAGSHDFVFPPECQEALAAGIPGARLVLVDRAGHSPMDEQPAQTLAVVRSFLREKR